MTEMDKQVEKQVVDQITTDNDKQIIPSKNWVIILYINKNMS